MTLLDAGFRTCTTSHKINCKFTIGRPSSVGSIIFMSIGVIDERLVAHRI